jgi:hypothetical protein
MPRINRIQRAKLRKPTGLWPPPATLELCRAACAAATIDQLRQTLEQLRSTTKKTENEIARSHLEFEIDAQLKHRFSEELATGLSRVEAAKWSEILGDRKFVEWHVARNARRAVRINAVPIGGSLCRG